MCQQTLTAPTHSPDGDPIPVPSNSTSEGEGITRTGGGSCCELPSNMSYRENEIKERKRTFSQRQPRNVECACISDSIVINLNSNG